LVKPDHGVRHGSHTRTRVCARNTLLVASEPHPRLVIGDGRWRL